MADRNRWKGALWSSANDECGTPQDFFDKLNAEFKFSVDCCASKDNYKVPRYYSIDGTGLAHDGLVQDWAGETCWVNPPYSQIARWMRKCSEEGAKPNTIVVALVYSRTDTKWFHSYCYGKAELRFIKGRLKFVSPGNHYSAPAPSMLVIWRGPVVPRPK